MALKIAESFSILVVALAGGMFWGPWLALTISIHAFAPQPFLAVVGRLNRNMAAVMTVLLPAALGSIIPVLVLAYGHHRSTFWLAGSSFVLYLLALVVTVRIEVPLVKKMVQWRADALPADWQQIRDRWSSFHIVRVVAAIIGLGLLVIGALTG